MDNLFNLRTLPCNVCSAGNEFHPHIVDMHTMNCSKATDDVAKKKLKNNSGHTKKCKKSRSEKSNKIINKHSSHPHFFSWLLSGELSRSLVYWMAGGETSFAVLELYPRESRQTEISANRGRLVHLFRVPLYGFPFKCCSARMKKSNHF